ncbi:MAG: hypothetical protein Lokiarch_21250 [Candidatus Lokiarchaeum sp. GC14_75]|nr:MAG: hypothetical protein Lokiarch_21250 [Candidatus Lokiarchaeum sp. GC14_75]
MSLEREYSEISTDWRHRDNLTWQIPSILITIGGGLVAAAFLLEIDPQYLILVRSTLLLFDASLSFCLTHALGQNIFYQVGSSKALEWIIGGKECQKKKILGVKCRRIINPKDDLDLSRKEICKFLKHELRGSTILFILCIIITVSLFCLFFYVLFF